MPEHAHDWPVLSLYVIGSYWNHTEVGDKFISGPSAVFYRARAPHRNTTAVVGFEQVEIEFDPRWIGQRWLPSLPVTVWLGGRIGEAARYLARTCAVEASEEHLRAALRRFLGVAARQPERPAASWIGAMTRRLGQDPSLQIGDLAAEAHRHPSWVGSAYRRATGEGLQQAAARFRVERAACLLRESGLSCAAIALEAGFCDQSHMNRTFRRVLGRLPTAVREDRRDLRQTSAAKTRPMILPAAQSMDRLRFA